MQKDDQGDVKATWGYIPLDLIATMKRPLAREIAPVKQRARR